MNVLGIETSCDETAASVVRDGKEILSQVVSSSLKDHQKYGGIIPEIASRRQIEWIQMVVRGALKEADLSLKDIHAVAVTESPGLIGSLLVGISYARGLAYSLKIPLREVNHIEAHLYANFLRFQDEPETDIPVLPAIGLVVSGGHSSLFHIKSFRHFKLLGQTRDDAAGEAYDKVARLMGLGYPGGPILDKLSRQTDSSAIRFKCAKLPESLDFSFSGVKTAVLYHLQKHPRPSEEDLAQIAFAFQESVVSVLVEKSISACKKYKLKTLVIGGGVAANSLLRKKLTFRGQEKTIKVFFPALKLCLDNASMVGGLGYQLLKQRRP